MTKKRSINKYIRLPKDAYGDYLMIKCSICGRVQRVRVNDKQIYTAEILNKYICWRCK